MNYKLMKRYWHHSDRPAKPTVLLDRLELDHAAAEVKRADIRDDVWLEEDV